MTAATMTSADPAAHQGRARSAVVADAAASGVVGAALVAGAGGLDSAFGTPASALVVVGAAMLAWAVALGLIVRRGDVSVRALRTIVLLNAGWVVASVAVAIIGWDGRTTLGTAFVLAQALAVGALIELQVMALKAVGRVRA